MKNKILLNKIKEEFPKLKIIKYKIIEKGWDNSVLLINNKYIFRFPRNKENLSHFKSELSILKELNKISKIKLPDYIFISKERSFGGYKLIEGFDFTKRVFNKLNNKEYIAKQLAHFLSILHNFPIKKARKSGFSETINYNIEGRRKEFEERKRIYFSTLSKEEVKCVVKYHEIFFSLNSKFKKVIRHGDLVEDHILVNVKNNKINGIIDFGDTNIGDPAADFAYFYTFDKEFVNKIYKNYKGPKDKNFLLRAKYYRYQISMNNAYYGVINKDKKLLNKGLKD